MIYVVRRSGSPAIGAWIVDPHLLVYRQAQAAYYPQFIVEDEPVVALACAARCWQCGDSTPHVSSWVVCERSARRCSAAYHVDFTIEQHTCRVALARGHQRPGGVAVRTRVIDVNLIVTRAGRVVTADHVHQAIESCRRHAGTCCGQNHARTPGIGCGVINLHRIERTTERHAVESTRHIDVGADSGSSTLRVWHGDRSQGRPTGAVEALVCGAVIGGNVEPGDGIEVGAHRDRGRVASCIGHGRFILPRRFASGRILSALASETRMVRRV